MALYDHQQSPRLGQPAPVESTSVRMFSGVDIPEAAWAGQMIYRTDTQGLQVYNGTAWEDVVGGVAGILTYVGPDIPVAHGAGDLWFDSDDGRKLYVAAVTGANSIGTGQWELSQDSATAQTAANNAQTTANTAQSTASNAFSVASGKNTVYYQTAQPTGGTYTTGDVWFDTDDGYKPYTYSGGVWNPMQFGSSSIADGVITAQQIASSYVYAGTITADQILTGTLSADTVIRTGDEPNQRVEIRPEGLLLYASDNSIRVNFPTTSPDAYYRGNLSTSGLFVEDNMEVHGQRNVISIGSVLTMQTQVTGSSTTPTVSTNWPIVTTSYSQLGVSSGFCVDSGGSIEAAVYSFYASGFIQVGANTYSWPSVTKPNGTVVDNFLPVHGMVEVYNSTAAAFRYVIWGDKYSSASNNGTSVMRYYDLTGVTSVVAPTQVGSDRTQTPLDPFHPGTVGRNINNSANFVTAETSNGTHTINLRKYAVTHATGAIAPDGAYNSGNAMTNAWGNTNTTYDIHGVVFGAANTLAFHPTDATDVFAVAFRETTGTKVADWVRVFRASDGARLPNYDFPYNSGDSNFTAQRSTATGGYGGFRSMSGAVWSNNMTKYTDITWTTESSTWWAGTSWQDTLVNPVQQISLGAATAGTVTITFHGLASEISQTTASLAYNASASDVQTALENLAALVPGDVIVRGGPWPAAMQIYFSSDPIHLSAGAADPININASSAYGGKSLAALTVTPTGLTGGTVSVTDFSTQHESNMGGTASWTMEKRKQFTITGPALPPGSAGASYARGHDDPSGEYFYVGRGSTKPANTAFYRLATQPANGVTTLTTATLPSFTSGTNPLTTSNFPSGSSAQIVSSAINSTTGLPKVQITGDGFAHFENLNVSGGGVAYMEKVILQSSQNATTGSGNAPALRIGDPAANHLRVGDGQIIAMSGDTTQATLVLNNNGGVRIGNSNSRTMTGIHYNNSTGTTDANSDVSFTHPLGVNPDVVLGTPGVGDTSIYLVAKDTSSVTFRCRKISTGALVGSGVSIQILWIALDF